SSFSSSFSSSFISFLSSSFSSSSSSISSIELASTLLSFCTISTWKGKMSLFARSLRVMNASALLGTEIRCRPWNAVHVSHLKQLEPLLFMFRTLSIPFRSVYASVNKSAKQQPVVDGKTDVSSLNVLTGDRMVVRLSNADQKVPIARRKYDLPKEAVDGLRKAIEKQGGMTS
ncbi:hypothetical protein PMAYCL1PPCAC_21900, partial [Pristionchus mayeri]